MLHLIISPAKSLNTSDDFPSISSTVPVFLSKAESVNAVLKRKSKKQLMKLQGISEKLAEENYMRNQDWCLDHHSNGKPAMFLFDGEVYAGLDPNTLSEAGLHNAMNNLHILSGLYGLLRPNDRILPYRLEMGTSISIARKKSLYEYWRGLVTDELNSKLDAPLINLASQEYAKVLDLKKMSVPVVDVEFKEIKNGQAKVLSFFAKKARGMMARFILENEISTIEDLTAFDIEEYQYMPEFSTQSKLVFHRF